MTTRTARIEISRPGRYTATDGKVWEFTAADLAAAAGAYSFAEEPAPLVVGHPALDAPAYGWAGSLAVEGDKLVAVPRDVAPSFAEAVRAGTYKRVSASWYPPQHPQNPRPGVWYLKHIGFLGGAAPSIRGLEPVHFSEAQLADAVTIDFTPEEPPMAAEQNDQTADFAEREAAIAAQEQTLADREAAVATREEDASRRDAAAAAADRQARHDANVAFAEGLIAGGKLKPFGKDKLVGLMDVLESTARALFGEAGELAPIDVFKDMLSAADPVISFGEAAPADDDAAPPVNFAAPSGYTIDQASLDTHRRALALQAEQPGLSYLDAVKQAG